jgi:hypothetical protein
MQPRALCPYGSAIDRAYWHLERLAALSAQPCPLGGGLSKSHSAMHSLKAAACF